MVVDRQHVLGDAAAVEVQRPPEDRVDGGARLLVRQVVLHDAVAAAGVGQVVEADAGYLLRLHQVEDLVQVGVAELGERDAQADAQAHLLAVADPLQRLLEGAQLAAEPVVHRLPGRRC